MQLQESRSSSRVYQIFKEIHPAEYRSIIRFFEEYGDDIRHLEFNEYFDVQMAYLKSLFEIGNYKSYLRRVNPLIEDTILHNVKYFKGKDIYQELLFRKASAHYHQMEYAQTEHILKELIKIDPNNDTYKQFYKRNLSLRRPNYIRNTRALSILLFIFSTLVIAAELLIVRNFFADHALRQYMEMGRNGLFAAGLLILIGGELFHRFQIHRRTSRIVSDIRRDKKAARRRRKPDLTEV